MQLLYTDETNVQARAGEFFVYAGIVVPGETAAQLHEAIEQIRARRAVPKDYVLKFNPGPVAFSHDEFIGLKQDVLEAAAGAEARMLVSAIHHGIVRDKDVDAARRNAINTILYHFNCFLSPGRSNDHGIVLIDRFSDKEIDSHVREKMSTGVTGLPYSSEYRLDRILGCHYSAIGQSHFCSLVDVALGSLRFAINAHGDQTDPKLKTAATLLRILKPLFLPDGTGLVSEISFCLSPKAVKADKYRARYESLKAFLADRDVVLAQEITDQPRY